MTRSIVQKAVVVLARQVCLNMKGFDDDGIANISIYTFKPIFGPLRQKLAVITSAWFNQRDFTQLGILHVSPSARIERRKWIMLFTFHH